ncbi:MAG: hypothetical protein HC835_16370 [Oscillatoriales cyanobacterium RM2_1_1]|nr:hypothetical protein [Oscillatoriales cyanobacterium SM2_3_0]NJO47062.1 hypothetical protein [Oscillatoriales cyanobacterium RM2_1_1]
MNKPTLDKPVLDSQGQVCKFDRNFYNALVRQPRQEIKRVAPAVFSE